MATYIYLRRLGIALDIDKEPHHQRQAQGRELDRREIAHPGRAVWSGSMRIQMTDDGKIDKVGHVCDAGGPTLGQDGHVVPSFLLA